MKPVIITIGHTDILLKDDKGAAALLKALSTAYLGSYRKGYSSREAQFHVSGLAAPEMSYPGKLRVIAADHAPEDVKEELEPKTRRLPPPRPLRLT